MRAIVGLGNPGAEYEATRHNAGFMLADALAAHWRFPPFKRPWRWRARVARGEVAGEEVLLVKPQTYMNRSGGALGPVLEAKGFAPEHDLLVLVDEAAIPLGTMRIRPRGSAGGHNGLKSIAGRLGSEEYCRLRIGVGLKPPEEDQADFVLSPFEPAQLAALRDLMPTLIDAVECWMHEGIETAMNRFNRRGPQSD